MTTTQGKYIYIHTTGYGTTAVKGYALSQQVSITLTICRGKSLSYAKGKFLGGGGGGGLMIFPVTVNLC